MAPGAVNVLDDILGEGEGLDFDATSPRVGAERRRPSLHNHVTSPTQTRHHSTANAPFAQAGFDS